AEVEERRREIARAVLAAFEGDAPVPVADGSGVLAEPTPPFGGPVALHQCDDLDSLLRLGRDLLRPRTHASAPVRRVAEDQAAGGELLPVCREATPPLRTVEGDVGADLRPRIAARVEGDGPHLPHAIEDHLGRAEVVE